MSRYWDDELYHHGIKGQSWGDKNGPPYPLNSAGKAKFREKLKAKTKSLKDGAASVAKKINAKRVEKKTLKAQEKERKHEEKLNKLTKSPTLLYRNKDKFTTEEINSALKRMDAEQRLHEMSIKELNRGKQIANTIIGYGKMVNDAIETVNKVSDSYGKFDERMSAKKKKAESEKAAKREARSESSERFKTLAKAGGKRAVDLLGKGGDKILNSADKYGGKVNKRMREYGEDRRRYSGWSRADKKRHKARASAGSRNYGYGRKG